MKTNLDKLYKTDESIEKQGVYFNVSDTTGFQLKRFGGFNSDTVKSKLAKYHKPYAYQIQKGTMDPKKEQEINCRVFVESCMVDWKGVEIDGKEVPFSADAATELLLKLPDLADALLQHSTDSNNYREDLGNS